MFATVSRYRVPGVLTAERPGATRQVFVDDGKVVFVTSSDFDDSLGAFLLRRKMLTPEQILASSGRIAETGKRQGEALVEMGLMSAKQMEEAVLAQISEIVWSLFGWEEGDVTFEVGRFREKEQIQLHLPLETVIREGIFHYADPKALVRQVGPSWTLLEPVAEAISPIPLESPEQEFLSRVDGRTQFGDLCRKGPGDAAYNARVLYLFLCLDLIRRKAETAGVKKIQWRTSGMASEK